MMKSRLFAALAVLPTLALTATLASSQTIVVNEPECLPNELNRAVTATVTPEIGGGSVWLNFRRVNPDGAFYSVEMREAGGGTYWTVLPKPEDREQQQLTDEWWNDLDDRDWLDGRGKNELEDYFDELELELAEYFITVLDATGRELSRSEEFAVEVMDKDDCDVRLTPHEDGFSSNLIIAESESSQYGDPVFHWLCDGIVTRRGADGVLRADEFCRACVVAFWYPAAAAAGAIIAATTIDERQPREVSRSQP